jgi:hypothetical protein
MKTIQETDITMSRYRDAKEAALVYQTTKNDFIRRAKEAGLGDWQLKPAEIEQFQLSWVDD